MAIFYEMKEVPFKPRAYERAAMSIASFDTEMSDLFKQSGTKALADVPGVGPGIAAHIFSILKTGTFPEYEKMRKKIPINLEELGAIEGVGPKTMLALYKKLGVKNRADLEHAVASGKLAKLPHFGKKSAEKIAQSISFQKQSTGRFLLGNIKPTVEALEKKIKTIPGVIHVVTCGSYRRMQETVGDIDIQATAKNQKKIIDAFLKLPEIEHIYGHGSAKANVRLKQGIDADLRVIPDESFGAALQYFTGDKIHNIEVRKIAIKKGLKLNEYGLFRGAKKIAGRTEEEVYEKLGLDFIPPELRTASGEIEAARTGKLPKLIPYNSIRGDLQVQTSWTDGENSIAEMAEAAQKTGLEYIAITDHTRSLAMTGGLDEAKLARQGKEIDKLNSVLGSRFSVLKSAEVNILNDGKLDIADSALKKLDVVCVAVHSHFTMTENETTERIIRAIKNPLVNILFHPTGRLIGKREPYKVDILKLLRAAKQFGVAMEANASPDRLDLRDAAIRDAVRLGVKLIVDSDAHALHHFKNLNLGIAQVRRGWGTSRDVLNTKPVDEFLKSLRALKH